MTAHSDIRGANRLVRLLSPLTRPVADRTIREILRSKLFLNQVTARTNRLIAEVSRIRSHVSDVTRLIQALRKGHRLFDAEAHPRTGSLL